MVSCGSIRDVATVDHVGLLGLSDANVKRDKRLNLSLPGYSRPVKLPGNQYFLRIFVYQESIDMDNTATNAAMDIPAFVSRQVLHAFLEYAWSAQEYPLLAPDTWTT